MTSVHRSLAVVASFVFSFAGNSRPARAQHGGHGGGSVAKEESRPEGRSTEKLKVTEEGSVTFKAQTAVGEWLLDPGTYRFQHVVEGEEHFVRFGTSDPQSAEAARVKCGLEPLRKPAKKTQVYVTWYGSRIGRVERIEVRGESVRHVF